MEEGCDYDIMLASQESPLFPSPNEKGKEEPISQNEMVSTYFIAVAVSK